jgi:hypothetical protein
MIEHTHRILLDCPPGPVRPGDLFPKVIEATGLEVTDFVELSRFFGCWSWALKPERDALYIDVRGTIAARIKNLYHAGQIRYGEW